VAVRIPVVVSQHERRSGAVADYEEKLITQLIFENGLDATLVADLQSIELDTTDHLCIEGLKGDFAIATWQPREYICRHLHRLGIPSLTIVPVDGSERLESNTNGSRPKSIYFISLSTENSIEQTIATLRDLRLAKSTHVVSLGPSKNSRIASSTVPSSVLQVVPLGHSKEPQSDLNSETKGQEASSYTEPRVFGERVMPTSEVSDDFPNIDQLMDDLDQFEL
jgi:hypothetical protein